MRLITPILVLALILFFAIAWDRPEPPADLSVSYQDIKTVDGQMMQASEDIRLGYALFEGLISFNPYTFKTIPGVASHWEISSDLQTYTFHLRKDAKWSDGTPITAEDFAFSWRIGLMPDTGTKYVDFLYKLRGGKEFAAWCQSELERVLKISDAAAKQKAALQRVVDSEIKFKELVGVKIIDDHTLVVHPDQPTQYFEELLACWPYWPLPRHILTNPKITIDGQPVMAVDVNSCMLRRNQQWIKPENNPVTMITNGPFRMKRFRFKRDILLEANEHYWNHSTVGSKTLRLVCCKDLKTNFDTYTSGAVDVMYNAQGLSFAPDMEADSLKGERNDISAFDSYGVYYYVYNTRPKLADGGVNPFADKRVRRAFSLVIDKKALTDQVTRMHQTLAHAFINKGWIDGYNPPKGLHCISDAPDEAGRNAIIAEAKALLAEAGYPEGKGFPSVEILVNSGSGHEQVAQALRNMWATNLGLSVTLETQEWKVFLDRRSTGKYMIARSGWYGDYVDPTTFLELFQKGNGNNDAGFEDEYFESLLNKAAATLDKAARYKILEEAERYVAEDQLPGVPLYYYKTVHLYDPEKIEGVSHHARDIQMLHLYKKKKSHD